MTPADFRAIRRRLGHTQQQMGERLGDELGGYSRRAVQDWESGARGIPPSVRVLMRQFDAATPSYPPPQNP